MHEDLCTIPLAFRPHHPYIRPRRLLEKNRVDWSFDTDLNRWRELADKGRDLAELTTAVEEVTIHEGLGFGVTW